MFKFDLSFLCIMLHPCPGFLKSVFLKLQKAIDSFEKRVKILKESITAGGRKKPQLS